MIFYGTPWNGYRALYSQLFLFTGTEWLPLGNGGGEEKIFATLVTSTVYISNLCFEQYRAKLERLQLERQTTLPILN